VDEDQGGRQSLEDLAEGVEEGLEGSPILEGLEEAAAEEGVEVERPS
jgi:hypothetical protein